MYQRATAPLPLETFPFWKSRFIAEENPPQVFVKNCTGGGPRAIPSQNLGSHMLPDGG